MLEVYDFCNDIYFESNFSKWRLSLFFYFEIYRSHDIISVQFVIQSIIWRAICYSTLCIIEHFELNFGSTKFPREFSTYAQRSSGESFAVSDCHFSDEVVKFNISAWRKICSRISLRVRICLFSSKPQISKCNLTHLSRLTLSNLQNRLRNFSEILIDKCIENCCLELFISHITIVKAENYI